MHPDILATPTIAAIGPICTDERAFCDLVNGAASGTVMLEIGHGMLGDKLDVGRPGPAHGGIAACPPYHREQDVLAEILPISLRQAAALADFLSKMFSGCGGNVCKTLIPFEGTFAQFVQLLIHGSFHPPVPCVGVQNRPRLEPQGRGTMVRNGD